MLNEIILQGRFTREPELRTTGNNIPVTSIRLAVTRDYTPKGQDKITDFINCVAWRQTAELICKYFHKGDEIILRGQLQRREKTDREGKTGEVHEVIVERVWFEGGKATGNGPSWTPKEEPVGEDEELVEIEGDLPF